MPDQELRFKDCYFIREGNIVTLGNSRIERAWAIRPRGLNTISFFDKLTELGWAKDCTPESIITTETDPICIATLKVKSVEAEVIETPVSQPCLRIRFTIKGQRLMVWKYFDIYPEVPAIRAWLELRSDVDMSNLDYTQVEALLLDLEGAKATAIELHDLTDATNHLASVREFDLSEERRLVGNNIFIQTESKSTSKSKSGEGEGIFCYKESPVPNSQLYHLYYDFQAENGGVSGIGAGFHNLPAGQTRRTYAFTFGVYSGGMDGGILVLKEYQAARYKLVPERDYIISANSWGDFHTEIDEANMIAEVEAAAELGIECVAVDAGWTRNIMGGDPDPVKFPQGFGPLCARAKELGVKLELWTIPNRLHDQLDVLKEHPDWVARTNNLVPCDPYRSYWDTQLLGIDLCHPDCFRWMKEYYLRWYDMGFERFKIDTFQMDGYDTLLGDASDHYEALRRLMEELFVERPGLTFTQDSTRTNRPIYDYYMDYGIIFLENRYQNRPPDHNGRYLPWKTLRNLWQIAPYIPPQKLNMELSNDEEGYSPEYLLGTVMFANPLFWESLAAISDESKKALKPIIALYKQHQSAIYAGHIFPIGELPDGTTWTGFQSHDPKTGNGYMIVYREDNPSATYRFMPKFLSGPVRFESVTDDSPAFVVDHAEDGVEVSLAEKRTFRLYRYSAIRT